MRFRLTCNHKVNKNPTLDDVQQALQDIYNVDNMLTLSIVPHPESGAESIQIQSNPAGYYLPVISANDEERPLREFYNKDLYGKEPLEFCGNNWDPTYATQDYNLICRMVLEFFETGEYSGDDLR